ncbi:MAG TPA: hypothetical protein VGG27_03770 [Magnetospirillaceae bacterium]
MTNQRRDNQSGQAVLMGVVALVLLVASVAAGLNYVGARATLGRHQAGAYQMNVVKNALHTFVARNFYLPCPADGTLQLTSPNVGVANCSVTTSKGVVPWKTIGITYQDAIDAYGREFGYAVSSGLTTTTRSFLTTQSNPTYQNGTEGLNQYDTIGVAICTTTCATSQSYAYVLISYGLDGSGAYLLSGQQKKPLPASTVNEYTNTQDTSFEGSNTSFQVWPYDTDFKAGTSYFDDVLLYEKASDIVDALNYSNTVGNGDSSCNTYGNPGCGNSGGNGGGGAPSATRNSGGTVLAGHAGTITNSYSCGSGAHFCPGSSSAASLANTYSYSSSTCNGYTCTPPLTECLNLVGNLGAVCVHDPISNSGISIGNQNINGDWVGPNDIGDCTECFDGASWANYLVPTQTLTYNLAYSYQSYAFVDYLVDGGMQVVVDAYQAPVYSSTSLINSTTLILTQAGTPDAATIASELAVGDVVVDSTYFPEFTYITAINGTQLTVSQAASGTAANETVGFMQSNFSATGTTATSSADITNVAVYLNNTSTALTGSTLLSAINVGYTVTGPNIPQGTTINAVSLQSSSALSLSLSNTVLGTGTTFTSRVLTITPWTKVGTKVLSNGYDTNINNAETISGISTSGSLSITYASPTTDLVIGQLIAGSGISPGTTIASLGTDSVTGANWVGLSQAAVQGTSPYSSSFYVQVNNYVSTPVTTTLNGTTTATVSSSLGMATGQAIYGTGIPSGTSIAAINGTTLTLSQAATISGSGSDIFVATRDPITGITGDIANGSSQIQNVSPNTNGFIAGDHIENPAFPSGTYVSSVVDGATLSMTQNATASQTAANLNIAPLNPAVNISGTLTPGSTTITNINTAGLLPGEEIAASDLPAGYIVSVGLSSVVVTQSSTISPSGTETITIVKGTPVIGTTGNITAASTAISNLSISTLASEASIIGLLENIENPNLQDNTLVYGYSSTGVTVSKYPQGTETAAALNLNYYPNYTETAASGTWLSSSTGITVSASAMPGIGSVITGYGIPIGTVSTAISGTQVTLSQATSASSPISSTYGNSAVHSSYPACPGPASPTGLYGATVDQRTAVAGYQYAPIIQHPTVTTAAALPSQIWSQPVAGDRSGSQSLQQYTDQRDYQFANLQFNASTGAAVRFNILVFQVLPYIYTDTSAIFNDYGMLFEGLGACWNDTGAGRCNLEGLDEWWNPPVLMTSDCGQYSQ